MQPTFFINHGGGRRSFREPGPIRDAWRELEGHPRGFMTSLDEQPRATLVVSSYSEEGVPTSARVRTRTGALTRWEAFRRPRRATARGSSAAADGGGRCGVGEPGAIDFLTAMRSQADLRLPLRLILSCRSEHP